MSPHPNTSTALARVVIDELVAGGVARVVICPGSRSGALAIAAAEHPEVSEAVFIDERSAGFFALGIARASAAPAAVVCTSGTALANLYPAVVEADMACIPLIVLSADRPRELRGVGANQTIDQFEMFGTRVRRFASIDPPTAATDSNAEWRSVVAGLVRASAGSRPGPAHLNVAFREPTVPVGDDGRTRAESYPHETPRVAFPATKAASPGDQVTVAAGRGLIVAGDGLYDRDDLLDAAEAVGWPVLATALSGLRGRGTIGSYRELSRSEIPSDLVPDVVVAIGSIGPDPTLEDLVARAARRVRVDAWGRVNDPRGNATERVEGDPVSMLRRVEKRAPAGWREAWEAAATGAEQRVIERMSGSTVMTGGSVAAALNDIAWGALVAASSLPIREVDVHLRRAGPVYGNRGASGIDGFVSTALGVAAVHRRTLALAGDLSFLHDANGFLNDQRHDLTLIVVDNGGGGLFDSLPQSRHAPQFERLFVTPPQRDLLAVARAHGLRGHAVKARQELVAAATASIDRGGIEILVVPVDRAQDVVSRS